MRVNDPHTFKTSLLLQMYISRINDNNDDNYLILISLGSKHVHIRIYNLYLK